MYKGSKVKAQTIIQSTCLHLWTAAMDAARDWWHNEDYESSSPDLIRQKDLREDAPVNWDLSDIPDLIPRAVSSDDSIGSDTSTEDKDDWNWSVPNLSEGNAWNLERLQNLKFAIQDHPRKDELWSEGLEILKRHRSNYGEDGPQTLQLIWWEFPPGIWEAIRYGSSMNFLIAPDGHLEPNLPMTEEEQVVATKFVNELIRLQVLVPAKNLQGNCPLFCVEKPHEPGAY
jgi:hypothetical protein